MIIDCILDRKDNESYLAQGITHFRLPNGKLEPIAYDPGAFYHDVRDYGEIGDDITRAMDYGTEQDVKAALCEYVLQNEYNPAICDYIASRNWLTA